MWTLVLFTMLVNTNAGGGAQSAVTLLEFASEAACTSAAKSLAEDGSFKDLPAASYHIFGKCIQRPAMRGRF